MAVNHVSLDNRSSRCKWHQQHKSQHGLTKHPSLRALVEGWHRYGKALATWWVIRWSIKPEALAQGLENGKADRQSE